MIDPPAILPGTPPKKANAPAENPVLRELAERFEAQFVSEMLRYSGLNAVSESFGGGPGEEAFASFLTEAYADKMVGAGGVGLAESIYQAMLAKGK